MSQLRACFIDLNIETVAFVAMQMNGVVLPFTQAITLAPLGPKKFYVKMSNMHVYSAYNSGTLVDGATVHKVRLDNIKIQWIKHNLQIHYKLYGKGSSIKYRFAALRRSERKRRL